jgi:predicted dehydrogenase
MSSNSVPSRRDFLKGSAVVATGAALAGGLNIARSAHAAGSDVLKVALVGCGGRGKGAASDLLNAAEALGNNAKIVAVADAFQDNAEKAVPMLAKQFNDKIDVPADRIFWGFDAYQKAIACADMVILATSPGFRPIHYKAAVEAGKNIFMEKPCCIDAAGYRMLLEANKIADEKNLKVGVGFQRRHTPSYVETVKRLHDGAIGDLMLLRAYWNGGGIWFRERKPEQTEMEYQIRNWYHFVWLCGDNICEQHIHNLDVCNWVKGDHPVEANGMGYCVQRYRNRTKETGKGQIYDTHFVEFTYKDGSKMYSQCRHIPNTWGGVFEYVHGTKGESNPKDTIKLANGEEWKYQDPIAEGGDTKGKGKKKVIPAMVQEHKDLQNAIFKNEKYMEGHHGATSSFTAVLGRMATYSGQTVKWDDAAAKGASEMPERFAWDAMPKCVPDQDGNYFIPTPGQYKPY